jgi:hemolysin activation/secretion protein
VSSRFVRRHLSPVSRGSGLSLVLCFMVLATAGRAQDPERYRPKALPEERHLSQLPESSKPASGSARILVDHLKGMVFVDRPGKILPGPLDAQGIRVDSPDLQLLQNAELRQRLTSYLGKPVSIRELNEIAREIVLFYRHHNQPVVDVSIPAQDISRGVVQFVVTEARVGRVRLEGPCYFCPNVLLRETTISPGDKIDESVLMDDLQWLNRNPFRAADVEFQPGEEPGQTDVVFKVKDRPPIQGYLGYEDTGTAQTGLERVLCGVNWSNALWLDHQAAYQYTASPDFVKLQCHSGVYAIPLLNRDALVVSGSYATVASHVDAPFLLQGYGWQTSIRYQHPFGSSDTLKQLLCGGFDFKQTNTNLDLGGSSVYATPTDIAEIAIGYQRLRHDSCGAWCLGADLFVSPSGFSSFDNSATYQQVRANASAAFLYSRMYIERVVDLPWKLQFMGRATGQAADVNLLPSEQLGLGGFDTVRGYDMRLVNGDSGYVVNLELRTEPVSLGLDHDRHDSFQFLVFHDLGGAMNHTLSPGESPLVGLSSVGIGARYAMAPTVALRFDYGWQLEAVAPDPRGSRAHISAVISY